MGTFTQTAIVSTGLFACAMVCTGCPATVDGSGELVTVRYGFRDFGRIVGHDDLDIAISHAEQEQGVDVTIDDNLIDFLSVTKNGDTLDIRLEPEPSGSDLNPTEFSADIRSAELEGITLTGGSAASFSGFDVLSMLKLTASDGSSILAKPGQMLQGTLNVTASGSSSINLSDLPVKSAVVNLSGGSSCSLYLMEGGTLTASLASGSKLVYCGKDVGIHVNSNDGSVVTRVDDCESESESQ